MRGMENLLFINGRLLDAAAGRLIAEHEVSVRGDRISAVSTQPLPREGARVIDLAGRTLMPGMIDCHVHVTAAHLNIAQNAAQPNAIAAFRAIPLMRAMLRRGFTTVRDAGGADWSLAEAQRTGLIEGPRLFVSGKALSQTGGHGDLRPRSDLLEPCACSFKVGSLSRVVDGVDACRLAVREEIQKGADQIKIMASGGVASPVDPVHFLGFSRDEIKAMAEEVANMDTYLLAHAYTAKAITRAVECGVRTIEHGNLVDRDAAQVMAAHTAIAVPTLITYEALASEGAALGLPPESVAKIERVRSAGRRSLEIFAEAGVTMALGSDLLGASQRLQSEELVLRAEALGAVEALRAATVHAARVVRREGELGVIAAGAVADLLVVDGNPLQDIRCLTGQGDHLDLIVQGGRVVHDVAVA
jgi:imidazolonepropionase-like amidohydrolase